MGLSSSRCLVVCLLLGLTATGAWGDGNGQDAAANGEAKTAPAEASDAAANAEAKGAENDEAVEAEAEPEPPKEEEVAIAFKDVPLEKICSFYNQKLGKPVISYVDIKGTKITIIHHKNEPLTKAMQIISVALRQKGVIIREFPEHIEFRPIADLQKTQRPVVDVDQSVSNWPNKTEIVDKIFDIKHYDVLKLNTVIVSMLPAYGSVMADPNVRKLIVTDTVANLERIEKIIERLDVPMADETEERVFKIVHADASDILSILRALIGGSLGKEGKEIATGGAAGSSGAGTIFIEHSKTPVLLKAVVGRNWIIAVAPAHVMEHIAGYIEQYDVPEEAVDPFEVIFVEHADMGEIAQQITQAVQALPNEDIRQSLQVVPFTQSRKLFVFGSQRGRQFVHSLIEKLDVPTSEFTIMKEFPLKHAEAERIAEMIETLFSNRQVNYSYRNYRSYRFTGQQKVKITYDKYRNSVTVVTDPNRMKQIADLIETEWDRPLDLDQAQPRVYHLKYVDPVKVVDILESMYTTQSRTTGSPWWPTTTETTPVGRLAGQFAFEAMEDSNVLIVTTKSTSNYDVIDSLIEKLDVPPTAGLPMMYELKHANAEDLAEQLNAMFSERGTPAQILRSKRALSDYPSAGEADQTGDGGGRNQPREGNQQTPAGMMDFWWSKGSHPIDQQLPSNLIGRPRIVPVIRRNALLVLAPLAFQEKLGDLIEELDKPGMQVVVQAIIIEVRHSDTMTVGIRVAADPSIFDDPRLQDSAVGADVNTDFTDVFAGGRGVLGADLDVSVLIQLLDKHFDLRVLNKPRLYTSDNQEAHFFDGQSVPFQEGGLDTPEGGQNRSFAYRDVGTRLVVRPHITREGEVDLNVSVGISSTLAGTGVAGNPIFDVRQTDTQVVVMDGQTVMLSGILRQEQFSEKRKVPLLGDIPLLGGLFTSTDTNDANRELIIFLTPQVVRTEEELDRVMDQERQILEKLQQRMEEGMEED